MHGHMNVKLACRWLQYGSKRVALYCNDVTVTSSCVDSSDMLISHIIKRSGLSKLNSVRWVGQDVRVKSRGEIKTLLCDLPGRTEETHNKLHWTDIRVGIWFCIFQNTKQEW